MTEKKIQLTVRMPESVNHRLKHYIIGKNKSITQIVNELIEEYLQKEGY